MHRKKHENLSVGIKALYALGQVAQSGACDSAMVFVFFYYTSVLGLSGLLVGGALGIAFCFDALIDPLVGFWSDNITSRWGRRIPLMVVATPLVFFTVGLLFSPPNFHSRDFLFFWLVVTSVAARGAVSLFNVPYVALGAELSDGYLERSSIVAFRTIVGILISVLIVALAYSVFFSGKGGLQRPEGYPYFGWTAAGLVFGGMVACLFGIAGHAAALPQARFAGSSLTTRFFDEVREIFRNSSFRSLFFASVVIYAAVGLNVTLNNHVDVFVWGLRPEAIQFLTYGFFVGMFIGVPMAPALGRIMEKRTMLLTGIVLLVVAWLVVPLLRIFGIYVAKGISTLPALLVSVIVSGFGSALCTIAFPSMMADAADEHELHSGQRREGLYFSGLSFAAKAASGLGVVAAGIAVSLSGIQHVSSGGNLDTATNAMIIRLVAACGPAAAALCALSLLILMPYGINRKRHDAMIVQLREKRAASAHEMSEHSRAKVAEAVCCGKNTSQEAQA